MQYSSCYVIKQLTEDLIFIKWYKQMGIDTRPESAYLGDLGNLLNRSPHPLYFLSDLRLGRIIDVGTLQKLGRLTRHENYGGGSAFSEDVISNMFVGIFSHFADAQKGTSVFYKTLPEALSYLEALKPGVTGGIDWQAVLTNVE